MFSPLMIGFVVLKIKWGQPNPSVSPWFIFLIPGPMVLFGWLHNKIQPKINGDEFGLSCKCVRCKHDLSGHDSALGDEIWIGPDRCSECGFKYPAVG